MSQQLSHSLDDLNFLELQSLSAPLMSLHTVKFGLYIAHPNLVLFLHPLLRRLHPPQPHVLGHAYIGSVCALALP